MSVLGLGLWLIVVGSSNTLAGLHEVYSLYKKQRSL